MSNGDSGYGGYPYYYPAQPRAPLQRSAQRSSAPIQLPGGVSIGGGNIRGLTASTSEYGSKPQQQQDYFGLQHSWTGQGTSQPTTQESEAAVEYDASRLAALGSVATGRVGYSPGIGSTAANAMSSAASASATPSFQQPQKAQLLYTASTLKPQGTSQYYGQQQDSGRIVTTSPGTIQNHTIQQPTSASIQDTHSGYGHTYQSGLHLPTSGQSNPSYNQNREQATTERRQAQTQASAPTPVPTGYQTTTHFSTVGSSQTSVYTREQAQVQRRQAMQTHDNDAQSQAQQSVEYNDYQTVQNVQDQQYLQSANTAQSLKGQAGATVSRASNSPANSYCAPTPMNHTYLDENTNAYNTQSVTPSSSVKTSYNTSQADSSSDNYSVAYSTPVQRTPNLYINTESLPTSKSYQAPQPPARTQTPTQPVSKPSPRLHQPNMLQQQAHATQPAQAQAQAQARIQTQIAKAQAHTQAEVSKAQAQALKEQAEAQARAVKEQAQALALKEQAEAQAKAQAEAEALFAKQQAEAEALLAKQQAEAGSSRAEAEAEALQLVRERAEKQAQAKAEKQAQAKARRQAKAREKARQEKEKIAQEESQKQAQKKQREEAERVAKEAEDWMQHSSSIPSQAHSLPHQQHIPQLPEPSTISESHDNTSTLVQPPNAVVDSEVQKIRDMLNCLQGLRVRNPASFQAAVESLKGTLGRTATPVPGDASRGGPSDAHAPHTTNQQSPRSIANDPPAHSTGITTLSDLSDPSNLNTSHNTLQPRQGAQNMIRALSQSSDKGLTPPSYSQQTTLKSAVDAATFMSTNGSDNPPLSVDWFKSLLDGVPIPNFEELCMILERAGYIFDRSDFKRALVSDQQVATPSEIATNTLSVHQESTGVQETTLTQHKNTRGGARELATSEVAPNSKSTNFKGKNPMITNMSESSAQSTTEDILSPEPNNGTAVDAPTQPTTHGSISLPTASPMDTPPMPRIPTCQSVKCDSSEVQQETLQPDKQFVAPHMLWHAPSPTRHTPRQSQPQFNNDDISYIKGSHDSGSSAPQGGTHKIPQSTQLSTQAPTNQQPTQPLSVGQVEKQGYLHNHRIPNPPAGVPVAQMAPVAPMAGMQPQPVVQSLPPLHPVPVKLPLSDTAPPSEAVPAVTRLPLAVRLVGKEPIVKKISKRKAARVSSYDAKTIARDILLATGRHPTMAPLNNHLLPLMTTLGGHVEKDSDLDTLRWDIIDPVPEGAKYAEKTDDDDLVIGDMEPVAKGQSSEKEMTPSPPRPRAPRSQHRWKKPAKEVAGESKLDKGKGRQKSRDVNAPSTPVSANPPAEKLLTEPTKPKTSRPRTSLGPRMKLVGPPKTPKAKPEEPTSKISAWTPVNKVVSPVDKTPTPVDKVVTPAKPPSQRSKLAAVVIQSRTPSAAEPDETPVQRNNRGKRKNEDTEGSARPKKRAPVDTTAKRTSSPPPMFDTVKCGWKNCCARLQNIVLLRKHVAKLHKHKASFGGYPCYWEGCCRHAGGGKGVWGKEPAGQYLDFDTEKEWEEHMESAHLRELGSGVGHGDIDGNVSDEVVSDLPQSVSGVKMNHIPLPPPPSQSQDKSKVKPSPNMWTLYKMGVGAAADSTPVPKKQVEVTQKQVEVTQKTPRVTANRRKSTTTPRGGVTKAVVHVLSDDD